MKEPVSPSKATRPKQFSILTRARRDTHGLRPSTIPVPIGEGTHLRVNWSDNVRYLDPVHRPQAQVEQTRTIVVTRARGTLNSMKLLGNSVKVFDHDKLATGIQRDPPPGPYIRLPDMVQTTKSTFKDLTGRTGRSGKMDARGVEPANCYSPNPHPAPVVLKGCSIHTTNHPEQLTANPATRRLMVQHGRTQNDIPPTLHPRPSTPHPARLDRVIHGTP